MSPVVIEKAALTPEDLLARPDGGSGYDLVDGQLEVIAMSAKSCRIGGRLYRALENYCDQRPGWAFPPETGFRCYIDDPNRVRKPDVSFIAFDRYTQAEYEEEGFIETVPDMIAEVISPNDIADAVDRKIEEWLTAGVQVVWVVHPPIQVVREHRPGGGLRQFLLTDTLIEPTLLPGFACPIAELFRLPGVPVAMP